MKITELPAYKRLKEMFEQKGYSQGVKILCRFIVGMMFNAFLTI